MLNLNLEPTSSGWKPLNVTQFVSDKMSNLSLLKNFRFRQKKDKILRIP